MEDTVGTIFYLITYIIVAIALFLNSLGVYILMSIKSDDNSQHIFLLHLSCIKILISLTEATLSALEQTSRGYEFREYQILDTINAGLYGVNDLIVVVLTIDRLIASTKPLAYNVRVTKSKLNAAVACCWFIGTCGIVPFFFLKYDLLYDIFYKIVFLTLDAIVLLSAFLTYGTILKKLLSRHNALNATSRTKVSAVHSSQTNKSASVNRKKYERFFYVSGLIIASFILFVAIPDSVYVALVVIQGNEDPVIERSIGFVWSLYLLADPIIYIFLQRSIRRRLKQMTCGNQNNIESFSARTIRNNKTKNLSHDTTEPEHL